MKHNNKILLAALLAAGTATAHAADSLTVVTGAIFDAATKAPIAGARIQAYNNKRHVAMTAEDGTYTLSVPRGTTSVYVTYVGCQPVQVPLAGRTKGVNVNMYSEGFTGNYDETTSAFVADGFTSTGLTADISIDPQIAANLGGQMLATTRGGVQGQGYNILVAGINSLSAGTQPLVVIDGIIQDMQYDREMIHDGFYNNILANISVDDIADVQLLRNGTAIYGAKGANGVLLITTKRCHSMATRIDVSLAGRYEAVPSLPKMMNASQYRGYASELLGSTPTKLNNFKFLRDDPAYHFYPMYHNDTNWQDEVYEGAWTQNYGINVQGGDDIASYNLSLGYAMADNTLKCNDYNRFNLRLNSDIRLANQVWMRFDAAYSDVNRDMRDDGAPLSTIDGTPTSPGFLALVKAPFLSPYALDVNGGQSTFLAGADDFLDEVLGNKAKLSNPSAILKNGEADNKNAFGNRLITITAAPRWDINKHLTLSETFNFTMVNADANYYLPVNGTPTFRLESLDTEVVNYARAMSSRQFVTTSDTRLAWNNRYGHHYIDLMGGFRYRYSTYELNSMIGYHEGSASDKSPNMSNGDMQFKQTTGLNDRATSLTWYAQASYNWKERYYLAAGLSMEASSRFGLDTSAGVKMCGVPWALFPSVSASWVLTNEDWFPVTQAVNYARINLSYDLTGNDNIPSSASRTYFKAVKLLDSQGSTVLGNVGNTDLRWETTSRLNIGLNLALLDNRLMFNANYFTARTKDLLSLQSLAYVTGIAQNWGNGGELKNSGYDLSLTARLLRKKYWSWEVGASVGHYTNEVVKLPEGSFETDIYGATVLTQVGRPVGEFYGYKTDGVFATNAEAESAALYITDEAGKATYFQGGDMRFVDTDGNHCIDAADRQVIGNPNPDVYGNIFTNLQWRRLRLAVNMRYSLGGDIYNYQRSIIEGGTNFYNQSTAMGRRWTVDGQVTDIPRATYLDPMGNSRFSDRWIEDGSYLKLSTVTLSYELPIDNKYIQGFTVWAQAANLFTLTHYLGSDPETCISNNILTQGIDRGLLASGRNFSLGVKINL